MQVRLILSPPWRGLLHMNIKNQTSPSLPSPLPPPPSLTTQHS